MDPPRTPIPDAAGGTSASAATDDAANRAERGMLRWLVLGNLLAVVLVGVLSVVSLHSSRSVFKQRALDATDNLARGLEQSISADIGRIDMALRTVALTHQHEAARGAIDPIAFGRTIAEQEALLPEIDGLRFADAAGRVHYGRHISPGAPVDLSDRDYFVRARDAGAAKLLVSGPVLTRTSNQWVIVFARRLNNADGSFAGIVLASVTTAHFQELFAAVKLGPQGAISLRTTGLQLVVRRTGKGETTNGIGTTNVSAQLRSALQADPISGTYIAPTALDQIERANAYRRVGDFPLVVLVGLATDDYLAPWRIEVDRVATLALLVCLVLAISSASVYSAWRRESASRIALLRDVAERERAERALRASEAFLDRTGRVAGVGGWELDLRSGAVTWSDQTCRIHDLEPGHRPTPKEVLGFYPPEIRPVLEAALREGIRSRTPWDIEVPLVTAKGRSIWVRIYGEVIFEGNEAVRVVGAGQDITERRQRQAELQHEQAQRTLIERHAKELDELLRERSEMLDVMAHEVRQPLNNASAALQSATTALAEVGEKVASLRLSRAQTVLGQVLARIDNTLAVASLLARPEPIERGDTDIDTLVAVVIADMPAEQRGRIRVERVTSTRTASMDMSLMRLALRNLLSNALSYSAAGSPVTVRLTDSDEPLALVIEVSDSGGGVPPEFVPQLFERGTRGLQAGAPPGHGLGLYIVRRVMELHGGRVELALNTPGGATMRLVIEQSPED